MSHKLLEPYTDEERANFIVEYNHNQGLIIEEGTAFNDGAVINALYALEANEIMVDKEVENVTIHVPEVDPEYEEKQAKRREDEFNKAFFNTSLGYIRRSVTMADGSKKDFLSDLLPAIKAGLELGQQATVLTYDKPPFDKDVKDWEEYQNKRIATTEFVGECLNQIVNDFLPQNGDN